MLTLFILFGNYSFYFWADKFTLSLLPPTMAVRMAISSFTADFQELGVYFRFHIQDISVVDGGDGDSLATSLKMKLIVLWKYLLLLMF